MSTWYRTGTVSVTNGSKNVVGTGTAWSVMISIGDVFTLDNSVLYEIQTITDDLHIVLDRNYQGSTATNQTYTIIPWSVKRSLNSEILDRINKLLEWAHEVFVTQWTTDTNGDYEVSTTLDKNIVPKVNNGASLGTTLKKWAKAYLTALSINGVDILPTTTPTAASIPIADSGGKIADGWIPAKYFNKTNILGTVSQSGGVPTGAVIERGSNANGSYVKFADGTMICRNPAGFIEARTASGLLTTNITFAAEFINADISIGSMPGTSRPDSVSGPSIVNLTKTGCDFIIHRTDTPGARIYYLAIGRWF